MYPSNSASHEIRYGSCSGIFLPKDLTLDVLFVFRDSLRSVYSGMIEGDCLNTFNFLLRAIRSSKLSITNLSLEQSI